MIQRGVHWQLLPASVLVAGGAARFLDGMQAPAGISSVLHPGNDVFAAVRTVYAGLTGVLPAPNQGLPAVRPPVSAPFAALLARGLQSVLTPTELLTELSTMIGEPASAPLQRSGLRFSGPLAPAPRVTGIPVTSASASVTRDVPPGLLQMDPPGAGKGMPVYPQASDGLHAVYWSSGILIAEALFLLFSRL